MYGVRIMYNLLPEVLTVVMIMFMPLWHTKYWSMGAALVNERLYYFYGHRIN